MEFRHEIKHEITPSDRLDLSMRLGHVMKRDEHGVNGRYVIRSLYFDTLDDTALMEKIDGVNRREKFRIRMYDGNTGFLRLEVKRKVNGLTSKESALITKEETERILKGDTAWMKAHENDLISDLYRKMEFEGLRPRTIVEYTREAFVYEAGNVRVTLDYDIRSGVTGTDFLNENAVTVPVWENRILLEVKWDGFLPDIIRDLIHIDGRRGHAFSKYAQARIYG